MGRCSHRTREQQESELTPAAAVEVTPVKPDWQVTDLGFNCAPGLPGFFGRHHLQGQSLGRA